MPVSSQYMIMKKTILLLILLSINFISGQNSSLKKTLSNFNKDKLNSSEIIEFEKNISNSPNNEVKVDALYALGKVFFRLEKYDKSYDSYIKALALANKLKSFQQIGLINEAIGNLQFKLGNFNKSEEFYKLSLLNFIKINDINRIVKVKGNLALIDIKKGKTQEAIASLTEITKIDNLDTISKSIALMSLGNIYLEKRSNPKLAIEFYQKSIKLLEQKQDTRLICSIYQNIAESYIALKQFDNALFYNKKSEICLNVQNDNELKATLYLFYSKIFEEQNNNELALKNYKAYQKYQQIVDDSKNSLLIENREISNQLKDFEIQNKIKEQRIKILSTQKSLAKIKIYLLILVILLICLIIYIVIKKQKIKISKLYSSINQSQEKLKFTENKTERIILDLQQNDSFIKHFSYRLKELSNGINDLTVKRNLNSLIFELQNSKFPYERNEQLYIDIPSTFLYNLEKKHPTLNEEERKLCILIFLNYKNKEIATSLNLSLRSIENYRYRIRRKICLETNTSLYQYFQGLQ